MKIPLSSYVEQRYQAYLQGTCFLQSCFRLCLGLIPTLKQDVEGE